MTVLTFTKPYPGGFRNEPDTSTPYNAAVGNNFQDTIAALVAQVNTLTATVTGGTPAAFTVHDNGDETTTITVVSGSLTVTDNGDETTTVT